MYATGHEDCVGFPDNLKPRAGGRHGAACDFENGNPSGGEMAVKRKAAIYMGNLMCIFCESGISFSRTFFLVKGPCSDRGGQNPTLTPALIMPWTP